MNSFEEIMSTHEPYPMHRLKRVDKPTTLITDDIKRIDFRQIALAKAGRGEYGPEMQKQSPRSQMKHPVCAALVDTFNNMTGFVDNEVAPAKAPITQDPAMLSRHIKSLGYFIRADIVGICRLPKWALFSHDVNGNPIDLNYQSAIVLVVGKHLPTIAASNGNDWISNSLSFQCYDRLAIIAHTMASYIRRLGYPALADYTFKPPRGYHVQFPPLLILSGIAELCRPGITINPFLGMAFKTAAVLTNLPLEPDKPIDFGLQDFCMRCGICAEACPSKAISKGGKAMYNGYLTWKVDEERCVRYCLMNKKGILCARCVKVCPWTRPNKFPHTLVRRMVQGSSLARRISISADKNRGKAEGGKWWFDLEDVDGALRIPSP